jgi:hypothetical protein
MSLIPCEHDCGVMVDPDQDPLCKIVNPYDSSDVTVVCLNCQEKAYEAQQERLMEDGPGPSLLEQQREAWRLK